MSLKHRCPAPVAALFRTAVPALILAAATPAAYAQCTGFNLTQTTGASIEPGTVDVGNHGDDVTTAITLPFTVGFYGVNYTTATVSSNGNIQFNNNSNQYSNDCLPAAGLGVAIFAHWDDMRTDGAAEGIFTSVTGVAPSRVFNIEWRTHFYGAAGTANYEIRLFEDQSRFEIVYGTVDNGGTSATVGVQDAVLPPTQYQCNTGGLASGTRLTFTCTNGPIAPSGTGASSPNTVSACGVNTTTLLTVVTHSGFNPASTGLAVSANLAAIGGPTSQPFFDNGTNGDVTAGDGTFSFRAAVPSSTSTGNKSIPFTVTDAQSRSGAGAIGLTVNNCPVLGPDVYVGNIIDIANYGASGNITAYAVGTDACNLGDAPVSWFASVNQHPVIAQNMFRLKNGRFEQLGQSWLKHGFSSTNSGSCGTCQQPPSGGQQLGISCSDAYGSGLNGSQGGLGPRSEVNATTGVYLYPFGGSPVTDATISRRLQVFTSDIDPAQNVGAQYFVDCHYVTSDDAQWNIGASAGINGLNNASYRAIGISSPTAVPSFIGNTVQFAPAIRAWQAADPTVQIASADYLDTTSSPSGVTGRFIVGAKVSDNGNGTWHYEYAVYNFNADRAGGSFGVPVPQGVTVSNIGFHGVFAHSGEPYPNTAANLDNWTGVRSSNAVTWTVPEPYVAPGNSSNALRWGTLYNFRFDANIGPVSGDVTIGLFKPATAASPATSTSASVKVPNTRCGLADINRDGVISVQDIFDFLSFYFSGDTRADINGVGGITVQDIFDFLSLYFAGCPA